MTIVSFRFFGMLLKQYHNSLGTSIDHFQSIRAVFFRQNVAGALFDAKKALNCWTVIANKISAENLYIVSEEQGEF